MNPSHHQGEGEARRYGKSAWRLARNRLVYDLACAGKTCREIGEIVRLDGAWVWQILNTNFPDWRARAKDARARTPAPIPATAGARWWQAECREERLRTLWAEGLSAAKIGLLMGCGANAALGKAHRLHLPARPSPIKRAA